MNEFDLPDFGMTLRLVMRRPRYVVTPGWLSKLSGVPKATIVNWLEGRVGRPRSPDAVAAICDALRLSPDEADRLRTAAGLPPDAPRAGAQEMARTTPPSTRIAAPVVPEAAGVHR